MANMSQLARLTRKNAIKEEPAPAPAEHPGMEKMQACADAMQACCAQMCAMAEAQQKQTNEIVAMMKKMAEAMRYRPTNKVTVKRTEAGLIESVTSCPQTMMGE